MTKKRVVLAVVLALVANVAIVLPVLAGPPAPENLRPIYRGDTIDIGPVLRAKDLPIVGTPDISADDLAHSLEIMATQAYTTGDQLTFLALDDYNGYYFFTTYTVVTITEHSEVWVQNDLNYYNTDGTLNAIHPDASDPLYVTDARLDYLADAFNTIAYPTDTRFFGMPDSHDGSNSLLVGWGYFPAGYYAGDGDKIVILVSNVRDLNFYDPVASGSYIAGFYSPSFEAYSDRNMITIDSKQWHRRVGGGVDRPYLYDSTLAHELQHLIHDDYSANEDTWPNEAMSGFAEFLNGYWFTDELGDRTEWQTWPENSVVLWGDQNNDQGGVEILADYQLVNSFALYTTGRIGGVYTDTAKITQESEDGILGFNKWLSDTAATNPDAVGLTFEDIFEGFRRDMLFGGDTDGAQPQANWNANFVSAYSSPLETIGGGPATSKANLGRLRDNLDREAYDWPGVPPFGTDFIEVCWSEPISQTLMWPVEFNGDEAAPETAWSTVAASTIYTPSGTVDGDVLHSGHTHLTDNFVIFGPVTVGAGDALTFDHYYNIEDDWDYGFVQVTTDTTGMTGWTSLDVTGMVTTTDPHAHPIIVDNVPGFSGFSGGWITATYDIGGDYSGDDVLLAFRYSTDWATAGSDGDYPSGWAVDNVAIGSTTLTTGAVGAARSIQEVRGAGNRFAFEFLTWDDGDAVTVGNVYTVPLNAAQYGTFNLAALSDAGFDESGERGVFMVSLMMDVFDDLIAGGIMAEYGDYSLTGLPPSICTSDVDAYGDTHAGASRVYAGQVVTAAVHADNLGSSPNITATGPAMFYIGVEEPVSATYRTDSATGGAVYTDDLSTVAGSFPASPGVYWTGFVTRTKDFVAAFTTDSSLTDGERVTVTVHYASDATAVPDQGFADDDGVEVESAFGLSAEAAARSWYSAGGVGQFVAHVINLDSVARNMRLTMNIPPSTTLAGISSAGVSAAADAVIIQADVQPYAIAGTKIYTLSLNLDPSLQTGDVVTSTMQLEDTATGDTVDMFATITIGYDTYLPLVFRGYPTP